MKIYTKSGDKGLTSLFGGTCLKKDHIRIEAYGTVDETNSIIGMMAVYMAAEDQELIYEIQETMFNIGSHLASDGKQDSMLPKLNEGCITDLESAIDRYTEHLEPLRSFILPGGSKSASWAHIARSTCRRAERRVVSLSEINPIDPLIVKYLNRLSDYLFTLSRKLNADLGIEETKWKPKK